MRKLTWRRILKKKGISPIIGVVLLSAVMFSVLALFFIWRASQEEFQLQRERERIQQLKQVQGEAMEFLTIPDGPLDGKNIKFYNNGTARPDFLHVYVDDAEVNSSYYSVSWDGTNPRIGYINFTGGAVDVTTSLKVESQMGNLYSYSPPAAVIDLLSYSDEADSVTLLLDGTKSNSVGGSIVDWLWTYGTDTKRGAKAQIKIDKASSAQTVIITLEVTDNTDVDAARKGSSWIQLTIPAEGSSGEGGEGYPGFGGEGAPGGIYISLGGTGGGTSIAEGRVIAFNIKNFSGRMIPLTSLRFYGVKNPSNYTCNEIYIAPVGKALTGDDLYYSGVNIDDGGIAQFSEPYYMGDKDEVHVEMRASSGARPQEGEVYMIILYDSATPQSYYSVNVPIREPDITDVVVFAAETFQVVGGGNILQGKSLDLNDEILQSIGIAFSSPDDETDPCDDRLEEFRVAGVAYWSGSVASESNIYLDPDGTSDDDGDTVPEVGVTWDNSRTMAFQFNFIDAGKRFYYFVYRFEDGSSIAHKVPRFTVSLASGEPEQYDIDASVGGTITWDVDVDQLDVLNTPVEWTAAGVPCYCTVTISPSAKVEMPATVTFTIEILPGAPTGLYPVVFTATNNLNAYSCVVFLNLT